MPVENSVIVRDIWANPHVRARAEAILREHFWNNEEMEVQQYIPLDDVMWCVAANPTIQQFVRKTMDDAPEQHRNSIERAVMQIVDSDLRYVVISQAWPRLNQPPAAEEGGDQPEGSQEE